MKEKIALAIVFIGGILMAFQYYFSHIPFMNTLYNSILDWGIILSVFALFIGIKSLLQRQIDEIKTKREHPIFPLTTLLSFFIVIILWLIWGAKKDSPPVNFIYTTFQVPLQATIFSLLAFYIASAAYRAFRAKSFSATILLLTASIVIIGRIPLGDYIAKATIIHMGDSHISLLNFPAWVEWILNVPNVGVKRAFKFGITLGIILTSFKVIFGVEKNWLK